VSIPTFDDARPRLLEYAREFIKGYTETIDVNFKRAKAVIFFAELNDEYFPLYGRQFGVDLAIAAFYTQIDFYIFFIEKPDTELVAVRSATAEGTREFGRNWTQHTPLDRRIRRVRKFLGIEGAKVLQPVLSLDAVNISGVNFMAQDLANISASGHSHGVEHGNQSGSRAEAAIPKIQELLRKEANEADIAIRYWNLPGAGMSPQVRGIEFEKLWRDVLDLHGWKPKKVRIPGEDNDFTAIYQGLHILGEVRWFNKPMDGGKMREFLAKLDPRPQTIGLFISYSGVDAGGRAVVRRAVNTKTVVIFGRDEIEEVMSGSDPGPIFDEKLREAYDYIFEAGEND